MTTDAPKKVPSLKQALEDAMHASIPHRADGVFRISPRIAADQFKIRWIYASATNIALPPHDASGSHFFLFFKNLNVSNLPLIELTSLLRLNTRSRDTFEPASEAELDYDATGNVQFFDDEQYTSYVRQTIYSLYGPSEFTDREEAAIHIAKVADSIVKGHGEVLRNTLILRPFFTSALVHIPLSLRTNIRRVVAQSGYIQSAGYSIYARRAERAALEELRDRLGMYFSTHQNERLYFTPYAHEYFSDYEASDVSISTRNGLDGVRLDLRKHFFSGQPLRDVLRTLSETYPQELYVAKGLKHYTDELEESRDEYSLSRNATIWMVVDHQPARVEEMLYVRSRSSYLIFYAQYQSNDNQFIVFKERKPGWVASTTLPHTLSTAMVNVGREAGGLGRRVGGSARRVLVVDPFCGTGTTLFDAALRMPEAMVVGFDASRSMPRVVKDNASFFGLSKHELEPVFRGVSGVTDQIEESLRGKSVRDIPGLRTILERPGGKLRGLGLTENRKLYAQHVLSALDLCMVEIGAGVAGDVSGDSTGIDRVHLEGFSQALVDRFNGRESTLAERICFYTVWRGLVSHRHALSSNPSEMDSVLTLAVYRELQRTSREFDDLFKKLHASTETDEDACFVRRAYGYSAASVVNPTRFSRIPVNEHRKDALRELHDQGQTGIMLCVSDAMEGLRALAGRVDLLIGDPPYWFNTSELDLFAEQRFYSEFIAAAVTAISDGGQLMIVLPAYAKNGRQIPFFQTRGAVVRQVISEIERQKKRAVTLTRTSAEYKDMFKPPFFWQSPAALSRNVLWFTIENAR